MSVFFLPFPLERRAAYRREKDANAKTREISSTAALFPEYPQDIPFFE